MTGCGGRLREAGDPPQPDVINCFDKKEKMKKTCTAGKKSDTIKHKYRNRPQKLVSQKNMQPDAFPEGSEQNQTELPFYRLLPINKGVSFL